MLTFSKQARTSSAIGRRSRTRRVSTAIRKPRDSASRPADGSFGYVSREGIMRWCCVAFEGHCQDYGNRGFSVGVLKRDGPKPEFFLFHRSVEDGTEHLVSSSTPLSLTTELRIMFCPWCGAELGQFYRGSHFTFPLS